MLSYLICIISSFLLTFFLERFLKPKTRWVWQRSLAAFLVHTGVYLFAFILIMLLFHRVYFSSILAALIFLLLVLVSNAKYRSMREVLVFQDLGYFTAVMKHPRLYLPYLGLGRFLLLLGLFFSIVYFDLLMEFSLLELVNVQIFYSVLGASLLMVVLLLMSSYRYLQLPTFNPTTDLLEQGLLSSFFSYRMAERGENSFINVAAKIPAKPSHSCPNLLVVQSESFFDARCLYPGISPEVLAAFDKIKAASLQYGRVEVPAWGANTVRTEFSFLSGLDLNKLGVHKFNPYRKITNQALVTLVSELRQLGYRTVCVHPYSQKFYSRHKVYPLMGFDEFIDISQFKKDDYIGPYIGDLAVAEKVCHLLDKYTDKPLFIFIITMENHGPLHLEQINPGDEKQFYLQSPPKGCDDLTLYLRHLSNADKMIQVLWNKLDSLSKKTLFCWYGDHVPIMSEAYSILSAPEGATDYFLWSNQKDLDKKALNQDLAIYELSSLIKWHLFQER
ncbi:Phosphoglycerol transferase, alkaline phosphatase superfamily [Legionella massiliensis]|uniref:Phosphoglycerol transferase, alkaline phosphatase superfamily n=1 Tax=Legionella massiliensis TaxID=1034943 RepID=A0A078KZB8_9GAMM|nr:LTA synthase family protein [Legionella massiliensis]CDZ77124.1 Phosphoglycerol transferase, alkaline phosphatase superfamily [Legionella massiliensis]CEE12862.1 Sulfatase [Legionella massiliensis]